MYDLNGKSLYSLEELIKVDKARVYCVMYACSNYGCFGTKEAAQKYRDDFVRRHSGWFCINGAYVREKTGWQVELTEENMRDYMESAMHIIKDLTSENEKLSLGYDPYTYEANKNSSEAFVYES